MFKKIEHSDYLGICPDCHEHTTAGESCCGRGAWIEDSIVSDEDALEEQGYNSYSIHVARGPYQLCRPIHRLLWKLGFRPSLSGKVTGNSWNVYMHVHFKKGNYNAIVNPE